MAKVVDLKAFKEDKVAKDEFSNIDLPKASLSLKEQSEVSAFFHSFIGLFIHQFHHVRTSTELHDEFVELVNQYHAVESKRVGMSLIQIIDIFAHTVIDKVHKDIDCLDA